MDRFQQDNLGQNQARYMATYVWGEDLSANTSEEIEETEDGDCSVIRGIQKRLLPIAQFLEALKEHAESECPECAAIARAEQLLELEAEAPCTCRQSDADLFDASGCEFHNPNSPWNVRMRAVTSVERYEGMVA